ncbi:MAG: helix-turn-helix transcriptional regulator, partial [Chlorobia bacterium]|nr:helix-turn-helix transcriptional regulator [Fimbriimonadaceae bacterium]
METRVNYEEIIRATVEQIQSHLDDPPHYKELADRAYLSPYHFHRILVAIAGETPAEMTRRLRLERAAWQIRNTEESITMIAFDAGYATHEAFTKAFQSEFGMSP